MLNVKCQFLSAIYYLCIYIFKITSGDIHDCTDYIISITFDQFALDSNIHASLLLHLINGE